MNASQSVVAVVEAFNEAFNAHDVDAVMALMTTDCVFVGTVPPDGDRYVGAEEVRSAWESFFASSPTSAFTAEEMVAMSDRVVVRWRYDWTDGDGGHPSRPHIL